MDSHGICEEYEDIATADLFEIWSDEAEWQTWLLFEAGRRRGSTRHLNTAGLTAAPIARSGGRVMPLLSPSKEWTWNIMC